ncbi:MAG: VOC family protein [Pyrinomonadaceae bacterium]
MAAVNAYLSFSDKCEEAFEFYKSVFGGEYAMFSRFGDMPMGMPMSDEEKSKIMHVALPIGNTVLMGSDTPSAMGEVTTGNSMSLAIGVDSREEAQRLFEGLSASGTVTMPLSEAPWNALFGMLTDKFGFAWMINFDLSKEA